MKDFQKKIWPMTKERNKKSKTEENFLFIYINPVLDLFISDSWKMEQITKVYSVPKKKKTKLYRDKNEKTK